MNYIFAISSSALGSPAASVVNFITTKQWNFYSLCKELSVDHEIIHLYGVLRGINFSEVPVMRNSRVMDVEYPHCATVQVLWILLLFSVLAMLGWMRNWLNLWIKITERVGTVDIIDLLQATWPRWPRGWSPPWTDRRGVRFTSLGPHGGLRPHQNLLER